MSTGTVKSFDKRKGFGFITPERGRDIFVHFTEISGNPFTSIAEGDEVEFEVTYTERGPEAIKVMKVT